MTDRQLAVFLGIIDAPNWPQAIAAITPTQRASYERMATLETEIELWQQGLGPKPKGVLVDGARTPAKAKAALRRLKKRITS